MIRTLLLIAAASFVLMLAAFGGAAALGGPELLRNGWTIDVGDNDSEAWSGPTVERTLEWTGGDRLTIALPADVVFTQGDTPSVVVSGPETAVQRITLVDGRLAFADENGASERFTVIGRPSGLTVTITAPAAGMVKAFHFAIGRAFATKSGSWIGLFLKRRSVISNCGLLDGASPM